MKRPWQVWTIFAIALAVVLAGMGWLSIKAVQLDRAETDARRDEQQQRLRAEQQRQRAERGELREKQAKQRAELEKKVSDALWRMDTYLIPMISKESFRPYFIYRGFTEVPGTAVGTKTKSPAKDGKKGSSSTPVRKNRLLVPSPLLKNRSPLVTLYFQFDADGKISSPNVPEKKYHLICPANGIDLAWVKQSSLDLSELQKLNIYKTLDQELTRETLPRNSNFVASQWASNFYNSSGKYTSPVTQKIVQDRLGQPTHDIQQKQPRLSYGSRRLPASNKNDFIKREKIRDVYDQQNFANRYLTSELNLTIDNLVNSNPAKIVEVSEGLSEPLWVSSTLVLARRVSIKDGPKDRRYIQGLQFNWPKLQETLLKEIEDLLPSAKLEPVVNADQEDEGRMLATLPVRLVVDEFPTTPTELAANNVSFPASVPLPNAKSKTISPIWVSLGIAWGCVLLASAAVGGLLLGVVTLSERRGAFVSSVTHELRTPLTTFRMYAEMLAEDMVPDPQRKQQYLETLKTEADRLTHLVENVLSYSRIERGRACGQLENVSLGEIVNRLEERLAARAQQAEMQLIVEARDDVLAIRVNTDVSALEQILFNLVDNACKYAATAADRRLHLEVNRLNGFAVLSLRDHGPGITSKQARRLFRPFSKSADEAATTAPGVGLGLALCRRLVKSMGGTLKLDGKRTGEGACFTLTLPISDA